MTRERESTLKTVDSRALRVQFSEPVQEAFHDLSEIAQTSAYFDQEMKAVLDSWSNNKPVRLHEMIVSVPLIAEQLAEHVRATGDQNAMDVWRGLCTQLPEKGFTITEPRVHTR